MHRARRSWTKTFENELPFFRFPSILTLPLSCDIMSRLNYSKVSSALGDIASDQHA